jgi:predicted ATPase
MSTVPDPAAGRSTPRILLFGHPGSGKSSLLGALLQAGKTQGETLGAEIIDPSRRLDRIRDHIYAGADYQNPRAEIVSYRIGLRPRRRGSAADLPPEVVLLDCDGSAALSLLKHPDSIIEREVRGSVASAVVQSDLLALVVSAAASDAELDAAFDEFLMFLERVHGRKAYQREVGGFPIFVVLTHCDQLARSTDTRDDWEIRVRNARRRVLSRLAEFLEDQSPQPGIQSSVLPFGSIDLKGFAVAIREPQLAGEPRPPAEPYGVAELFRAAFTAAGGHRQRAVSSDRLLLRVVWAAGLMILSLLGGAVLVTVLQPPPADPGLADRVRVFELQEAPAAVRLAEKNITRNERALKSFKSDPGFFALPEDLHEFVDGRLQEIEDYRAYRAKLAQAPAPADARTLEELERIESLLQTDLALPPDYTWGDTDAARLRGKWLADIPLIRSAEATLYEWFRGLVNQATALTVTPSFGGAWRGRIDALDALAARPPFDPNQAIPGSERVPEPRGDAVTYRVPYEFDRVYQSRRDWDYAHARLLHERDLADALGLTADPGDPTVRALVIPPPGPAIDSKTLASNRLAALQRHFPRPSHLYPPLDQPEPGNGIRYPEWQLSNFPNPAHGVLAGRVREMLANGEQHVRGLILDAMGTPPSAADTPEGWRKVAAALDEPHFADWGKLLQLFARLENPGAPTPVADLARFLRSREFELDARGFDLAIPLALRVPQVVPSGPLALTLTPSGGGMPVKREFRASGDGTQQGLNVVYRLIAEKGNGLQYHPGDGLRLELPVRSGDQQFTLVWEEGKTNTFQFDRFFAEPKLVRAGFPPEPATGVTLTPTAGSTIPRVPTLVPDVRR